MQIPFTFECQEGIIGTMENLQISISRENGFVKVRLSSSNEKPTIDDLCLFRDAFDQVMQDLAKDVLASMQCPKDPAETNGERYRLSAFGSQEFIILAESQSNKGWVEVQSVDGLLQFEYPRKYITRVDAKSN